jgi:hypothetical protein
VREIRTLRAMWRALETGLRQFLNGHEEGNLGYKPRRSLRAAAPVLDPTGVFGHPVNGPRCARWTSYRRWRLCLRSEAPKLFLPISGLLLNGPYGRLPKPGTDHFQAIHNQYVGVPKF